MSVMENVDDSVSKEAICRHILPSLSEGAAHRLMTNDGQKRKRIELWRMRRIDASTSKKELIH